MTLRRRVVIAPDSFKGTLSAHAAALAIKRGVLRAWPDVECILHPMADGGEGTLTAVAAVTPLRLYSFAAIGAWGQPVQARYGLASSWSKWDEAPSNHTVAIVELAETAGIGTRTARDISSDEALSASTWGTGELMRDILARGVGEVRLALGGSATTDGGFGLLGALGARYFGGDGEQLDGRDARGLAELRRVDLEDLTSALRDLHVTIACDVANPLVGANGTAAVYGPQKGLRPEHIHLRDKQLMNFARLLAEVGRSAGNDGRDELRGAAMLQHLLEQPGVGAAGGSALPFLCLCRTRIVSGAQWVAELTDLDAVLQTAQLVITGEGKTDGQSAQGKVPGYITRLATQYGVRCVVLSGALGAGAEQLQKLGAEAVLAASPPDASDDQLTVHAAHWLEEAAWRYADANRSVIL